MSRYYKIMHLFSFLLLIPVACRIQSGNISVPQDCREIMRPPRIDPDYSDIVILSNIAPLNFMIHEPGLQHVVHIHSLNGKPITIGADQAQVMIPVQHWKKLLHENIGQRVVMDIYVLHEKDQWSHFNSLSISVAREKIDAFLTYRLIEPQYEYYGKMGIFQRNLEYFHETCFFTQLRDRQQLHELSYFS